MYSYSLWLLFFVWLDTLYVGSFDIDVNFVSSFGIFTILHQ